jgi:hypothetical protein
VACGLNPFGGPAGPGPRSGGLACCGPRRPTSVARIKDQGVAVMVITSPTARLPGRRRLSHAPAVAGGQASRMASVDPRHQQPRVHAPNSPPSLLRWLEL